MVRSNLKKQWRFLRESLSNPSEIGGLAPSSLALAEVMVSEADLSATSLVVELGPGTGAVTDYLLRLLRHPRQLLAIENNEEFVQFLRRNFPQLQVVHGDAEKMVDILNKIGLSSADVVISSLPWASFPDVRQTEILNGILAGMKPNGLFSTFTYTTSAWLPRARHFRKLLHKHFAEVKTSPIVWGNIPPAFAYLCRDPR